MKKFICIVCGYIYEGDILFEVCFICKVGVDKFKEMKDDLNFVDEYRIGILDNFDDEILEGLRVNFIGECIEVGMYLVMFC